MEGRPGVGHAVIFSRLQPGNGAEAAMLFREKIKEIVVFTIWVTFQNVGFELFKVLRGHDDGVRKAAMLCLRQYLQREFVVLLMIDNYDSFTFNLVQYFIELGVPVHVMRNDEVSLEDVKNIAPDYIVISPGPCSPKEAGISKEIVAEFAGKIPILGVCLGHQCIADVFGGQVTRSRAVRHGKTSLVYHDGSGLFAGLSSPITVARYHSLQVEAEDLPEELVVNAWTMEEDKRVIMGVRHQTGAVHGVQFHPESFLTEHGHEMLHNFLFQQDVARV